MAGNSCKCFCSNHYADCSVEDSNPIMVCQKNKYKRGIVNWENV